MARIPLNVGGGGSSLDPIGNVNTPFYVDQEGVPQVCTIKNIYTEYIAVPAEGQTRDNIYLVGSKQSSAATNTDMLYKTAGVYINSADVLRGAGWNDFAETREVKEIGGTCVVENGDGTMSKSTKRLQRGAAIVSDTYGMLIGPEGVKYSPIAVAGRVLARVSDISKFKVGRAVCSGENGLISPMNWIETILFPDRIVGYVSEIPKAKIWNKIKTSNRIWITVR